MKNKTLFIWLSMAILSASCSIQKTSNSQPLSVNSNKSASKVQQSQKEPMLRNNIYIDTDEDGVFELVKLKDEERPKPQQGDTGLIRSIFKHMSYPASARKNGITGVTLLEIFVNEFGAVQAIDIKKGFNNACDEEAKKALLIATKPGFTPLIYDGSPIAFKMHYPISFKFN